MRLTALVPAALILSLSLCAAEGEGAPSRHLHGGKKTARKKGGKKTIIVHPGESIQDAIDFAQPGDTVKVLDGEYVLEGCSDPGFNSQNYGLGIVTDHLTLVGSKDAIIDTSACVIGIKVGARPKIDECPVTASVTGVKIKGFTIRSNMEVVQNVMFTNADDYEISGSRIMGGRRGLRSICSRGGLIKKNYITRAFASGISMLASSAVVFEKNTVTESKFGVIVDNSWEVSIKKNILEANTNGIYLRDVYAGSKGSLGEPSKNIIIQNNHIKDNNRLDILGDDCDQTQPHGIGIFNFGSDEVTMTKNTIVGNDGFGILILPNPTDPDSNGRFTDQNIVKDNKFSGNGDDPDVVVLTIFAVLGDSGRRSGADIAYVPVAINFVNGGTAARDTNYTNCFDLGTGGRSKSQLRGMPVSTYFKTDVSVEELDCSKKAGSKHKQTKKSNTVEKKHNKLH